MSDTTHEETPPPPTFPNWLLSVLGIAGSIVVLMVVLAVSYYNSRPTQTVDANIAATRKQVLSQSLSAETDLYNKYDWVDQKKNIVRIPVAAAMKKMAERLDAETKGKPEPPARLSLEASQAGFTPVPPPTTTSSAPPAVAGTAPAAAGAPAPAAAATAPAAAPAK
jgi:hypothetical protein